MLINVAAATDFQYKPDVTYPTISSMNGRLPTITRIPATRIVDIPSSVIFRYAFHFCSLGLFMPIVINATVIMLNNMNGRDMT